MSDIEPAPKLLNKLSTESSSDAPTFLIAVTAFFVGDNSFFSLGSTTITTAVIIATSTTNIATTNGHFFFFFLGCGCIGGAS